MKKLFKDNPQRLVFWTGFIVVVLLVLGGTGYSIYKIRTAKNTNTDTKPTVVTNVLSAETVGNARKASSISGTVKTVTGEAISINSGGSVKSFVITANSQIKKGSSLEKGTAAELTIGKNVSIAYNNETKEVFNIWYQQ